MLCSSSTPPGPLSKALAESPCAADTRRRGTGITSSHSGGFTAFLASQQQQQASTGPARGSLLPIFTIKNAPANSIPSSRHEASAANRIDQIGRAIRNIYSAPLAAMTHGGQSLEALYLVTDGIVLLERRGDELYERVKLEMERAVGQTAGTLRASDEAGAGQQVWLEQLSAAWSNWRERSTVVCNLLTLLDQAYIAEDPELKSLEAMSLDLFKHSIIDNTQLQQRALSSIASVCNGARNGATIDYRPLHSSVLSIFSLLQRYEILEGALLACAQQYLTEEAARLIETLNVSSYLAHVDMRITSERDQAEWLYADATGREKAIAATHLFFVKQHTDKLLSHLPQLLTDAASSSLTLLYGFLSNVGQLPALRSHFAQYVREQGEQIVLDRERDDEMIERLLLYKSKVDRIVGDSFRGNEDLRQAQKESFESFVNKRENKPAELIAKFLDGRLRSGNKTMSDQELEHVLDEGLILFRYTHAKDMFEEFYKRLFAKRLLLNRSASSDAEQSMLLKLKAECGPEFTQKLETMLTDIALSDEMMKAYGDVRVKAALYGAVEPFEMGVNVLTQAHWPAYPQVKVMLPSDMASAAERFADFYETRSQGRMLHWAHSLGTASLTAQFAKAGEKELLVSTFQTIVLLLFNGVAPGERMSYVQIKQQTGLEDKELRRTLQSLACGQIPTRVLRKEPQGKDIHDDDQFAVNEQLKNDRKRIRINMIQLNESQEEQKSTVERVMFDREMVVQATAVRILKARKTIKHAEFLQEIVQSIAARFTVDVSEIKKAFEVLIDKEYMERVEGQRGMYRYMA